MKKILILASNPRKDLNVDTEIRDLKRVIESSRQREDFTVVDELAVRVGDLQELMLKHRPQIVHFCGHGGGEQGLVFESDVGREDLVRTEALSDLFRLFSSNVECVLLNACYSEEQADAIVTHINYVIGMNQEIRDDAAIAFAKGFYRALGYACAIEEAYDFGCNAIQLEISGSSVVRSAVSEAQRKLEVIDALTNTLIPEHLKPILKKKPNIPSPNLRLSQETRAEIQLDINKDLEKENPPRQARKKSPISNFRIILLSGVISIVGLLMLPVYRNVMLVDPRYTHLEELLKAKKWTSADRETALKMWEIAGKSMEKSLTSEDFKNFPCRDLQKIDNLWLNYSDKQFGFSVQTRIWKDVNGQLGDFVSRVGWGEKKENGSFYYFLIENPDFNLSDPKGRLPWYITYWGGNNETRKSYISKLIECGLY